jgi:uncharacterized protein involved in exopolysaccharide biosynthesis
MNPSETANTTFRILLHIIFKRKFFIFVFFVVTLAVVSFFTFGVNPTYRASSEILIKMGREHLFVPTSTDSGLRAVTGYSTAEQINSEVEIIMSRPLIERVIESIGPTVIYDDLLDKDPGILGRLNEKLYRLVNFLGNRIGWLGEGNQSPILTGGNQLSDQNMALLRAKKKLEVRGIKNSRIIEISFSHKDPAICALVLKKLVGAYLEVRPHIHKNTESFAFFKEQSEILKSKVRQIEYELKDFKEQNDVVAIDEERTLLLRQKSDLQADLNNSISEKIETENRIRQILSQIKSTPAKIQQGETSNLNPMLINSLEGHLVTLELKEKELLAKYTENNHLVVQVRDELRIVRQKLAEQESKRYGSASFGPNPIYTSLKEDLYRNEAEMEAIGGKVKAQMGQLEEYTKRLDKLNQLEYKFEELENQLALHKKNYQLYLTKYEENRISSEMDTKKIANVSVVKPSQIPLKPVSPKPALNLALGLFFGVFGGIGTALGLELLNDRFERPEDIESFLQAPVLASVPEYRR